MRRWLQTLCLAAGLCAGCQAERAGRTAQLPPGQAGLVAWRAAHAAVAELRDRYRPQASYTMNVTLSLQQPQLGQRIRARGAVAVRPPDALRMILLGPGGTTALDLWICGEAFRFQIPAIDLLRRGDAKTPAAELRGLPVDFLRWWFLRPLDGRLLAFVDQEGSPRRYLLGDGDRVVELGEPAAGQGAVDHPLSVVRRSIHDEESLLIGGELCGKVQYAQRSTGIELEVHCEKVNVASPPARAFVDPDFPDHSCGAAEAPPSSLPSAGSEPP